MKILVVGATGRLGGAITQALLAQGRTVRILVRRNSPSVELVKQGLAADFDMIVDSSEIARKYGVHQTTLEEVVRRSLESMAER